MVNTKISVQKVFLDRGPGFRKLTQRGKVLGRICSSTLRRFIIRSASTPTTGCCHPPSSNGSTKWTRKVPNKLGAPQRTFFPLSKIKTTSAVSCRLETPNTGNAFVRNGSKTAVIGDLK